MKIGKINIMIYYNMLKNTEAIEKLIDSLAKYISETFKEGRDIPKKFEGKKFVKEYELLKSLPIETKIAFIKSELVPAKNNIDGYLEYQLKERYNVLILELSPEFFKKVTRYLQALSDCV